MQQRSSAFFGLIALGIILLLAGLIYGLGSRSSNYKSVPQGTIAHYLTADGTDYLQMDGSSSLYIIHEDNFSPKVTGFADGDTISFVYDPAETTSIDKKSTIGTHLIGTASKVVQIIATDTNGQKVYKTPEYTSSPQGYTRNQWGIGGVLLVLGLLSLVGAFFVPKKKTPSVVVPSYVSAPVAGHPPFPYQQQSGQPQQPYPAQYPTTPPNYQAQPETFQQAPNTSYPQQPNPYGQQPTNPYGQQQQPAPNPYGQPPQQ